MSAICPYVGLTPFSEENALYFFGRDADTEVISANLLASRLTLLYGAAGVGKSSVLSAGVCHNLRKQAIQQIAAFGKPDYLIVEYSNWRDDPVSGLASAISEAAARLGCARVTVDLGSHHLADGLRAWSDRIGDLLVVLDQFEEFFLYHPHDDAEDSFAVQLSRAISSQDLRVSFLLCIREDALAQLDRFQGMIPNLFENYLRVEHLSRSSAKEAIERPIDEYNRQHDQSKPVVIDSKLVESVLDDVRSENSLFGGAGRRPYSSNGLKNELRTQIEASLLQLVMTRVWDEEIARGSHSLRCQTLAELGGATKIVRTHLDRSLEGLTSREREVAVRVFDRLVTPSGSKIAHYETDLAEFASRSVEETRPTLTKLCDGRILRPIPPAFDRSSEGRYEVFHDVLAFPILDWRTHYLATKAMTRFRAIAWGFVVSFPVLVAIVTIVLYFALRPIQLVTLKLEDSYNGTNVPSAVVMTERFPSKTGFPVIFVRPLAIDQPFFRQKTQSFDPH